MARIVSSPSEDVSASAIEEIQKVITAIKQIVVRNGTNEEILQLIDNFSNRIKNKQTRATIKKALLNSTNKMKYQYKHNITGIEQALINKVVKAYANTPSYVVNIYEQYLNKEITASQCITEFRGKITDSDKGLALIKDYDKLVREQVDLLASEPVVLTNKNGEKISLRNKVEMSIRYQANLEDVKKLKEENVKLVWCSSHADASPRCAPWQGRLYSLDGTSGEIDGYKYTPLDEALNANGGNSIINGYNCRHYLIEYEPKSVAPKTYTSEQIQKEYAIDQKQRQFENQIRRLKTEEALYREIGLKEEASQKRKKWQNQTKKYEEFAKENGRVFYRWRTRISNLEKSVNR